MNTFATTAPQRFTNAMSGSDPIVVAMIFGVIIGGIIFGVFLGLTASKYALGRTTDRARGILLGFSVPAMLTALLITYIRANPPSDTPYVIVAFLSILTLIGVWIGTILGAVRKPS